MDRYVTRIKADNRVQDLGNCIFRISEIAAADGSAVFSAVIGLDLSGALLLSVDMKRSAGFDADALRRVQRTAVTEEQVDRTSSHDQTSFQGYVAINDIPTRCKIVP